MTSRRITIEDPVNESTPFLSPIDVALYEYEEDDPDAAFDKMKPKERNEAMAAERLSMRLLQVPDDDSDEEERILRESLDLAAISAHDGKRLSASLSMEMVKQTTEAKARLCTMLSTCLAVVIGLGILLYVGVEFIGPPNQPVGPYQLVENQEGLNFFSYYNFYEGRDSLGSNGYVKYVGMSRAEQLKIVNVSHEFDELDVFSSNCSSSTGGNSSEPFVFMGSAPTPEGPREAIRLEGKQRYNRGLFIIDLRHMPAGCGVWPAFWLTDEANWPVNGEIDIVEGVNYQKEAKTALHATNGCVMDDIPQGVKTGTWDTAIGIPDKKTGIPDMTLRYATDCFVYNPHQWLNQGCVAVDEDGDSLGAPVNKKGGGVYALEWDPANRYIKTWVFSPHINVPENLREAIKTAGKPKKIMPDPSKWPIPYGYFAIGAGTSCKASHFQNMRLVFNLAFCGTVAGNRFHIDCLNQSQTFDTCNDWIKSEPKELDEAYWKIRGVYVYQREWERAWF